MSRWPWLAAAAAAVAAGLVFLRSGDAEAGEDVAPGSPVVENPDDRDEYSLGRVLASEEPRSAEIVRIGVAWAVVNMANRRRTSVTDLVTQNTGGYSHQGTGSSNWYCTTANEARPEDLELAGQVLRGELPDPTTGATNFDSPRAQRAALARHANQYVKTPDEVAAERRASGLRLVLLPGVDEERFRLWSPVG